jgi:PAS domain S-box-containing protein
MADPSPSTGGVAPGELERYRFLFHASPDAITFARWSDGVLVDVNPEFERMSGYSRAEALGKTALQLGVWVDPAQREVYARQLADGRRCQGFLTMFRMRDGSLRYVELAANITDIGEERIIIAVIRDCTGRRQVETELTAILDNASVGILFSRNRLIERCNRRLAEIYGCAMEDLIGQSASIFYPDAESYMRMGREAGPLLSSGQAYRSDWLFRKADGSILWCNVYAKAVDPADSSMGTVWVLEDITEARRTEKVLAQIVQGISCATLVFDRVHRVTQCK